MGHVKGVKPQTWQDGTKVDFDNWAENEPKQPGEGEDLCLRFNYVESESMHRGYWYARPCTNNYKPICQKEAIPGHDPKPTEYPPIPPHVNCETDWFYMESSGNCYHIDHLMISSFDAAESKCLGMGGHLASINSPEVQAEIRLHLNDPDAIGKFC